MDRIFAQHDAELGRKMAAVLAEFHAMYVAPLAEEIAWLRQPWYRRAYLTVRAWLIVLRGRP